LVSRERDISFEEVKVCTDRLVLCLFCKNREEKIDLEASRYGFYPCRSSVLLKPGMT